MKNRKKYITTIFSFIVFISLGFATGRPWYQRAHIGGDARHRCTAFSIGNKGYYGAGHVNSGTVITYKDYWEYDPATNSWTQIADFGGGLRYHSSAFTIDGAAYVGGGEDHESNYTNDFWKYIPEINTWFPISDLPAIGRRGGVAFTIDGKGYYGTGQSDLGYRLDFFAYDPALDEWSAVADFPGEARNAAVSFVYNSKGYVGTGHKIGEALNDFYMYDPSTDIWEVKTSVGGSIRQDAMGFCIDGKGYIGTGNDDLGNDFKDIWEYDFETDTWTEIAEFTGQKRRYAVTFVINDIPYLAGGTDGTNFKDLWAFTPSVSIPENEIELDYSIYPNPTTNNAKIEFKSNQILNEEVQIKIYDLNGELINEYYPKAQYIILDRVDFNAGTYIITFQQNARIIKTEKITFL